MVLATLVKTNFSLGNIGLLQILLLLLYFMRPIICGICSGESDSTFIQLTSNPQNLSNIRPGDAVTFTCRTTGSPIQQWGSVHYVDDSGRLLFFGTGDTSGTKERTPNNVSIGNLTMVDTNGLVLESELRITVSANYTSSNVTCINDAQRVSVTICFSVVQSSSTDSLTPTNNVTGVGTVTTEAQSQLGTVVLALAIAVPSGVVLLGGCIVVIIIAAVFCNYKKLRSSNR